MICLINKWANKFAHLIRSSCRTHLFITKIDFMKKNYVALIALSLFFLLPRTNAQTPSTMTPGVCSGIVANFNTGDNGFNSPSIFGSIFDSSFYFNSARGYFTDYFPPTRVNAPGAPRVQSIISPPYPNPNPNGTFTVGFYYIVNNPFVDRFQVRIISVTQTPSGTVTNVEATTGLQSFAAWSTPTPYVDNGPTPTPFLNGFEGRVCLRLVDPDIINAAGTTFRVEVSYLLNSAFFAVFDDLSIGPLNSPLPVNFIGLLGNRNADNTVQLKWDVSQEIDVREYQIERSDNGTSFVTAGSVAAKGKSIYVFSDQGSTRTVFYRVKSVDIDGRTKYSGILQLKGSANDTYATGLMIYPVPAQNDITIAHKRLERGARITITSTSGTTMKIVSPVMGTSNTMINISAMPAGLYFVQLDDGKGGVQTTKLVKN